MLRVTVATEPDGTVFSPVKIEQRENRSLPFFLILTGHIHFSSHTLKWSIGVPISPFCSVFVKKSYILLLDWSFFFLKYTLCLCSGISSRGLSQKLVHRVFTKLKIYFWKLLYLYKLSGFVAFRNINEQCARIDCSLPNVLLSHNKFKFFCFCFSPCAALFALGILI